MLRTVVKFLLLSEAFAIVTFAGGWSGVPFLALVRASPVVRGKASSMGDTLRCRRVARAAASRGFARPGRRGGDPFWWSAGIAAARSSRNNAALPSVARVERFVDRSGYPEHFPGAPRPVR